MCVFSPREDRKNNARLIEMIENTNALPIPSLSTICINNALHALVHGSPRSPSTTRTSRGLNTPVEAQFQSMLSTSIQLKNSSTGHSTNAGGAICLFCKLDTCFFNCSRVGAGFRWRSLKKWGVLQHEVDVRIFMKKARSAVR